MTNETIRRVGDMVYFTGSLRFPHGSQLDFSGCQAEAVASITLTIHHTTVRPGVYYAQAMVDEAVIQTSRSAVPGPCGQTEFVFVPALPTPQVYGFRYYRMYRGVRYNQRLEP